MEEKKKKSQKSLLCHSNMFDHKKENDAILSRFLSKAMFDSQELLPKER
jgi:hypothetical protein